MGIMNWETRSHGILVYDILYLLLARLGRNDPASLNHDFPSLKQHDFLSIITSFHQQSDPSMPKPKSTTIVAKQSTSKSPNASIQAFFEAEKRTPQDQHPQGTPGQPGDGFTEEEVVDNFNPLNCKFDSSREYEDSPIGQLVPGPRAVTFAGRIVHVGTMYGKDSKHPKAAGWHNLTVKDDSAAIGVSC